MAPRRLLLVLMDSLTMVCSEIFSSRMTFSGVTGGAGFLPICEPPTGGLYLFLT